jgi:S-adenosylmethionine synthetase
MQAWDGVNPNVTLLPPANDAAIEIVEHKGIGHPDTICDALAEELSQGLCRWYLGRFGTVLHHNVDKALLCGGAAKARFGGGEVLAPIEIILAGRATAEVGGVRVPVEEIAIEGSRAWLRRNLRALDVDRHVDVRCKVRAGSAELTQLFARARVGTSLANDTSCGAGFAPASTLERVVLTCADTLRAMARDPSTPHIGEDVKVMGVRRGDAIRLTVACAFVAKHVPSLGAYKAAREELACALANAARAHAEGEVRVVVNAADDFDASRVYLTVTGTSAEAGDDGQVGRGNRVNRLITPCRPMTLEAAAGKNPITHVGKLYQVAAHRVAAEVVRAVPEVVEAQCLLLAEIGTPTTEPSIADIRVRTRDGKLAPAPERAVAAAVVEALPRAVDVWRSILAGEATFF